MSDQDQANPLTVSGSTETWDAKLSVTRDKSNSETTMTVRVTLHGVPYELGTRFNTNHDRPQEAQIAAERHVLRELLAKACDLFIPPPQASGFQRVT
jgi:hypothetical protein